MHMEVLMAGKVAVGIQSFDTLIEKQYFYIDKTSFIREWWGCGDAMLLHRGIPKERIHCYGFAFQGRNVLIGTNEK